MKIINIIPLFLILALPLSIIAQTEVRFEHGCNFKSDQLKGEYTLFDPTKEASKIVDTILSKVAIKDRPFILNAANVENAQATISGRNKRYIMYSNEFLKKFTADARTKWAAYAVFAHEIGHHVLLHDIEDTVAANRRLMEHQADAWAGRILARMGANRADALAALNALADDNSRFYPVKSARIQSMGIAYDQEKLALGKEGAIIITSNRTAISIDPKSFNRWSIVKKENVKATIDDDIITVELINISAYYGNRTLYIKLTSNDGNMRVTKVDGTGENLNYQANKTIIWHYNEDEAPKITASGAEKLRVSVYAMNNKPQKAGGVGIAIGTAVIGAGSIGYGVVVRNQALADYSTYKSKLNENDAAYLTLKREEVYSNANSKYIKSQVFIGAGSILAVLGTAWWIRKVKTNRQAEEAGFAFVPPKKQWLIEPLVSSNGGVGLVLRF
jgi:hypothetical protein